MYSLGMSSTDHLTTIAQNQITSTVREVATSAMHEALVNCFPEVKRQVSALVTPEYLSDVYPHETLSELEITEITMTMAIDVVSRALDFCSAYEAAKLEKAIRAL
jgi:hypothetical protein